MATISHRQSHRILPYNPGMFSRVLVLLLCAGMLGGCAPAMAPAAPGLACEAIDGDTIVCGRERVRILNVDTPERGSGARCAIEAELAERARVFTAAAIAGGRVEIRPDPKRPRDRYGRTLAWVLVDGADVGDGLVAAGLARPWDGRRRPWCP